jgi:hypothetical protein
MAVAVPQGKRSFKKVKQQKGPLPVTLLSGFLVWMVPYPCPHLAHLSLGSSRSPPTKESDTNHSHAAILRREVERQPCSTTSYRATTGSGSP